MEVIKKKICLEEFVSRIPSLLETVENKDENENFYNSWGKIPKTLKIMKAGGMKYGTFIKIYYEMMNVIINSIYYSYDSGSKKWLLIKNYDWREPFNDSYNSSFPIFYSSLPNPDNANDIRNDREIIAITSERGVYLSDEMTNLISDDNIFDLVKEMNRMLGIIIVPPTYQGCFVPKTIYVNSFNEIYDLVVKLSENNKNCCDIEKYKEYGGDEFKTFLDNEKKKINENYYGYNDESYLPQIPTIDIPILLTSDLRDIGIYRTYDVDEIKEGEKVISDETKQSNVNNYVIQVQSESKLKTLLERRRTYTDDKKELPVILTKKTDGKLVLKDKNGNEDKYSISDIYRINYIKNVEQCNDSFYGDWIASATTLFSINETNEIEFNALKENLNDSGDGKYVKEGTTKKPFNEKLPETYYNKSEKDIKVYNSETNALETIKSKSNTDINKLITEIKKIEKNNEKIVCCSQDYSFKYDFTYKKEGKNLTGTTKYEGTVYVVSNDYKLEFTYVIGGRLTMNKNSGTLYNNEQFPEDVGNVEWDGSGMWYRETYPLRKLCEEEIEIDGKTGILYYDRIDFPKENYILCENVRYATNSYEKYANNDVVFKDEKMTGINFPMKEIYDVSISRGSSAAFERHLQLSDVKTWEDLEKYRNGMFLNK